MSRTAIVEEEVEEQEEEQQVQVPAKKAGAAKKKAPKRNIPLPTAEDEEEEIPLVAEPLVEDVEEAPVAEKPAKKKAGKKRTKKTDQPEEEQEQPEQQKKPRQHREPRAKGERFGKISSFQSKVRAERQKRIEAALAKGEEAPTFHKAKPGQFAKREINYLQRSNGLLLDTASVGRNVRLAMAELAPELVEDGQELASQYEARGKTAPAFTKVKEDWRVSGEAVQLIRGAVESHLNEVASKTYQLSTYCGRVGVSPKDVAFVVSQGV